MSIKIALVGQQCSGKTTAAVAIMEHLKNIGAVEITDIVKFAQPIYDVLDVLGQKKDRAFMQRFGDLAKCSFGELVFVQIFKDLIKSMDKHCVEYIGLICDDIRRKYELEAARELGFKIIYIDSPEELRRKRAEATGLTFIPCHNSETEVPFLKDHADYVIEDRGLTMDELAEKSRKVADMIVEVQGE